MKILVVNGPNLNMLGIREPEIYGSETLSDLEDMIKSYCSNKDVEVSFYQSNHEGDLVTAIQQAYFDHTDAIIINPAAYTHTSVALLDALKAVGIPAVEVHLSDVSQREDFRQISYVSLVAVKTIAGRHFQGYIDAIGFLLDKYMVK